MTTRKPLSRISRDTSLSVSAAVALSLLAAPAAAQQLKLPLLGQDEVGQDELSRFDLSRLGLFNYAERLRKNQPTPKPWQRLLTLPKPSSPLLFGGPLAPTLMLERKVTLVPGLPNLELRTEYTDEPNRMPCRQMNCPGVDDGSVSKLQLFYKPVEKTYTGLELKLKRRNVSFGRSAVSSGLRWVTGTVW